MQTVSSGTQNATVGTEHVLADNSGGMYIYSVDISAMLAGDTVELRVYIKMLNSADPLKCLWYDTFTGLAVATDQIKQSIPSLGDVICRVTLKQTAGTTRSFPWKVTQL